MFTGMYTKIKSLSLNALLECLVYIGGPVCVVDVCVFVLII